MNVNWRVGIILIFVLGACTSQDLSIDLTGIDNTNVPSASAYSDDLPLFFNTPSISTPENLLISPPIEPTSELSIPVTGDEPTSELSIPVTGGEGTSELSIPVTGGESTPEPGAPVAVPSSSSNNSDNDDKFQGFQIPVTGGFLIPVTGFAPNVFTDLSGIPNETYVDASIILDIPALSIDIPIVGVPLKEGTWNVSWLGNQAGWLEGSAFPSWNGNSVLTSHVYLPNGKPGPFAKLHELKTGDQVIVHAFGQKYIFEVLTNAIVAPTDRSIMKHEDIPWLTLVTCTDYDAENDTYKNCFIVRAVLVEVEVNDVE